MKLIIVLIFLVISCNAVDWPKTGIKIPAGYYLPCEQKRFDLGQTMNYLGGIERFSEPNKRDCSQGAAYVEWLLESKGIDAKICMTEDWIYPGGSHMYVQADVYYIDVTRDDVLISPGDILYEKYNDYTLKWENIYECVKYYDQANMGKEVAWWLL